MSMNLSALNMFRSALDWNNKGVANLDHKYAVLNDHEYGGWLSSIGRNDDEKEDNNRVRAELLRALGLAFKLKGISLTRSARRPSANTSGSIHAEQRRSRGGKQFSKMV